MLGLLLQGRVVGGLLDCFKGGWWGGYLNDSRAGGGVAYLTAGPLIGCRATICAGGGSSPPPLPALNWARILCWSPIP